MRPVRVGGPPDHNPADSPATEALARSVISGLNSGARASSVNRTHRVIRERARAMQADRSKMRGLVVPLALCSVLLIFLYAGLWVVVDQYELVSGTNLDGHRSFMVLLWFLPVSAALVAMILFRRSRSSDTEASR
jgi:hypothetical protein